MQILLLFKFYFSKKKKKKFKIKIKVFLVFLIKHTCKTVIDTKEIETESKIKIHKK